ncbi:MAG: chorismate synthase [Firmicutes bacterium]|nr:chorismate synthase [Bacillota bacterium]
MSNTYGRNIRISIFGESHGAGIGIVIDGVRPGTPVDMDRIAVQMARRAPGGSLSTARKEADQVEILSGVLNGRAEGTPICGIIRNTDTRSSDYLKTAGLLRPSHADYTGHIRYQGFEDIRGGGHFSARITAPLVFAGAVLRQALEAEGVRVGSHILQIHNVKEKTFTEQDLKEDIFAGLAKMQLPVLDAEKERLMREEIEKAREAGDSVGGIVETAVTGLPAGIGDPFFDSMESRLSQILFSVPAVKGISFGSGFAFADMTGSEANDPFRLDNGRIVTETNHNGGILGGITTGMPVVFQTVLKPTASIARPQKTVDIARMEEAEITVSGRHDPCIVVRAVPVIEACACIAVYDAMKEAQCL